MGRACARFDAQNGKVARETISNKSKTAVENIVMDFIYDESGKPCALRYSTNNGSTFTKYYYVLNLQGDVVKLIDASGTTIANYAYSAYGEILAITDANGTAITSSTHVANINPLRYRGYYYDTETGFYYLQSRYYDPVIGRFINADSYASTGQGILGTNMFAYCNNNPISFTDPAGTKLKIETSGSIFTRLNRRCK
jgi:RHS repeat-associated protein